MTISHQYDTSIKKTDAVLVLEDFFQNSQENIDATSKFSTDNLVQVWSRREAWKRVQRRMIKQKGKSIYEKIPKDFGLFC